MSGERPGPVDPARRAANFAAGRAVPVALSAIEHELGALWRAMAHSEHGAAPRAVTRACLWNLIVRVPPGERFTGAKRTVDEISPHVPTRVLVLKIGEAPASGLPLGAFIEANWHSVAGGSTQVGSDEITLEAAPGHAGDLAPLVRALLAADVPIAALWSGTSPDTADPLDRELCCTADRVIVDGADAGALSAFQRALGDGVPGAPIALSWLRGAPLRQALAGLFDPPAPIDDLLTVGAIEIAHPAGRDGEALLYAGWLASRLRLREGRRTASEHGAGFTLRRPDAGEVALRIEPFPAGALPSWAITICTGGGDYSVGVVAGDLILNTPIIACKQPFDDASEKDLWLAALSSRGRDPLFAESLGHAVSLL